LWRADSHADAYTNPNGYANCYANCDTYSYTYAYTYAYANGHADSDAYTYAWGVLTGPDRVEHHGRQATRPNDSLSCNDYESRSGQRRSV